MTDNRPQLERVLGGFHSDGAQPNTPRPGTNARIFAVPAAQAVSQTARGAVASLVSYLDFSPRNRELSTVLARRFVRTLQPGVGESWSTAELQDHFFTWLAPKVEPGESRGRSRRRFKNQSAADLRLLGLLDQYRAGGQKATEACPLFRAAYSEQA